MVHTQLPWQLGGQGVGQAIVYSAGGVASRHGIATDCAVNSSNMAGWIILQLKSDELARYASSLSVLALVVQVLQCSCRVGDGGNAGDVWALVSLLAHQDTGTEAAAGPVHTLL